MSYKKKGKLESSTLETMDEVSSFPFMGIPDRGITKETCEELGIRTKLSTSDGITPVAHFFPVTKKGVLSGYIRRDLKTAKKDAWASVGDVDISCDMLGQSNCSPSGGLKIFIVEGVYDWASVFQTLYNLQQVPKKYKPNVCSVLLGAANAVENIAANKTFVDRYQQVVLGFDSDSATPAQLKKGELKGQDAVAEVARLFPNILNVLFSRKDPSEFLKKKPENNLPQDPRALYSELMFQAKPYEPDDFVEGSVATEQLYAPLKEGIYINTLPKTSAMLHGIRKGEMTVVLAPAGVGKAQPVYSQIKTPNGFVSFGEVKSGDDIFGADGKVHKVVGVYPQGERDVYSITFSDGCTVYCDKEHLWKWQSHHQRNDSFRDGFVFPEESHRWNIGTLGEVIEYMNKTGNKVYVPMTAPVEYDEKHTPIDPYVMGVLLGDGSLSNSSISNSEKDIQEKVIELSDSNIGSAPDIIRVRGISEHLKEMGLYDKKSCNKFIPEIYLRNSYKNRLSLLRGLCDTDGFVGNGKSNVVFYTTSKQMSEDIKELVQSLGGTASIGMKVSPRYTYCGEDRVGKDCYVVNLKMPKGVAPISSEKHLNKYRDGQTQARRSIVNISYVGKEECVCIQTSASDSLYLTDGFVVTHNTTVITEVVAPIVSDKHMKVDLIYAEEDIVKAQQRFIALGCNVPLNKFRQNPEIVPLEKREAARKLYVDNKRTAWLDTESAFGKLDPDRLLKRLQWSAAKGYDFALIDHLTMMIYGRNSEVGTIDDLLVSLASHVNSTGQGIIAVSHITRRNNPPPRDKEGNVKYPYWIPVKKEDARGSGAYEQCAWNIICVEPEILESGERGRIRLRVDKNREWSALGITDYVRMNSITGRLEPAEEDYNFD